MAKRLITGEGALRRIHYRLHVINDIKDIAAIYTAVVQDAKVVAVKPTLDFCPMCGEALPEGVEECPACEIGIITTAWPGLRLEIDD